MLLPQFSAYRNAMKVAKRMKWAESVGTGRYVELVIAKVPAAALLAFAAGAGKARPMLVTALLRHEQKMSVVHYSVQRTLPLPGELLHSPIG